MSGIQKVLLCFGVLFVIGLCDGQSNITNLTEKLKIKILYESLCPDSYTFILRQLIPFWDNIAQDVDVTFVSFGKSSSWDNGTKFICQHGSAECKGNRIMGCALNIMTDQTMKVNYVGCFMQVYYKVGRLNPDEYGEQCAHDIDFNEVLNCYQTKQGTILQLQAEIETKKFIGRHTNFIPTIVYDEEFDQDLQDKSLTNMYDVVSNIVHQTSTDDC